MTSLPGHAEASFSVQHLGRGDLRGVHDLRHLRLELGRVELAVKRNSDEVPRYVQPSPRLVELQMVPPGPVYDQ